MLGRTVQYLLFVFFSCNIRVIIRCQLGNLFSSFSKCLSTTTDVLLKNAHICECFAACFLILVVDVRLILVSFDMMCVLRRFEYEVEHINKSYSKRQFSLTFQ